MGFTHVPKQLIFVDKIMLFEYAVVCIMGMDKAQIDLAPEKA